MALRKRKPTSPGRRFQTVSDFSEITKDKPERSLLAPEAQHRRPQQLRPQDRSPQGRRPQAAVPRDRLQAHEGRRARRRGCGGVRPEPQLPHPPPPLPRRREALHPRPEGREGRRPAAVRPGLGDPPRQRPAAALHPRRHHRARHRAVPRWRRQDGPLRRHLRPARGQGGRLRHPAPAEHRDAPRADQLPRHGRRGGQRRGRAHQGGQGRPQPVEGRQAPDPRRGHEPGRPPPRWWRGQDLRRPAPRVAVGQARRPYPRQDQAVPEAHRSPAPYRGSRR